MAIEIGEWQAIRVDETRWDEVRRQRVCSHFYEQFFARAQPEDNSVVFMKQALQELVVAEGRIVHERPHWSRSNTPAEYYIQIGDFLLIPIDRSDRDGTYFAPTVVNGREDKNWRMAYEKGWVTLPPKPVMPAELPPAIRARLASESRKHVPGPGRKPRKPLPLSPARIARRRRMEAVHRAKVREVRELRHRWIQTSLGRSERHRRFTDAYRSRYARVLWPAYEAAYKEAYEKNRMS